MIELRIEGAGGPGAVVSGGHALTIGRAWMNDLVLWDAPRVSGRHGQVEERDGALIYRDLGSRNGSLVRHADGSETPVEPGGEPVPIGPGDVLLLGGEEAPARIAVLESDGAGEPRPHLLTTLAADRPLVDVAGMAGGRGRSFAQFMVELVGDMGSERVTELLARAVLDELPALQWVLVYRDGDRPDLALARDAGAGPPPRLPRSLLLQVRTDHRAIGFRTPVPATEETRDDASPPLQVGVAAPLAGAASPRGVLVVGSLDPSPEPTDDDVRLAQTFAHYAGRVLEQARRREDAERRVAELEQRNRGLRQQLRDLDPALEIIGEDPRFVAALQRARQVAPYPTPVLITGPSGTGKELVARAIHRFSDRGDAPFLAINCGALTESLLEAELFGHEKGAFTGADQRRAGLFEAADGGTLLLDEVGEIPLMLQVKLLRVLQEGELFRVGSSRPIKVDVRILAATNRDLARLAARGRFREDLLYRLNVFPVALPPLRDRPGDIPLLAAHFAREVGRRFGKPSVSLSEQALQLLASEPWPGNVRELQNRIERAVILAEGAVIEARHVAGSPADDDAGGFPPLREARQRFTRDYVQRALDLSGGVQRQAARLLGIDPGNLSRLLRELGLR